ncbi:hypothetical protein DPQ22_04525 [Candidatus Tokpelaia sp.]|nr:hypothetical protein DPQ22_04525 [Candidatus Tokpelaia sp.]
MYNREAKPVNKVAWSMERNHKSSDSVCSHRQAGCVGGRWRPFSLRLLLLASVALSPILDIAATQQTAQAAIVGNDLDIDSSGNDSIGRQTGGAGLTPVIASQNSIAMVGDGDCHALSGVGLADRVFNSTTIWGDKDTNRTGGVYGFGEQKPVSNAANGLTGGTTNSGGNLSTSGGNGAPSSQNSYNGLRYFQGSNAGAGQTQGSRSWYASNDGFRTGYIQNGPGYATAGSGTSSNPAAGAAATQALGVNSVAIGCDARANGYGAYAMGWGAWASGAGATAFGINSRATGQGSLAFGIAAQATGEDSIAQGSLAVASNKGTTAIGALTTASGTNSTAIGAGDTTEGTGAQATGDNSVALGYKTRATGTNATAIGAGDASNSGAAATAASATALGYKASASVADSVALGSQAAAATAAGITGYDAATGAASAQTGAAWVSTLGAASVGDASNSLTRQITGVSAGAADTDAVNVAQLKGLAEVSIRYDDDSRAMLTLAGSSGTKLTNLSAGTLSDSSTDAVNGSQLNATNANVSTNAANIAANTGDIATNKANIADNTVAINSVASNTSDYFGGGADVSKNISPTYTIQRSVSNNVGDAFKAVDNNLDMVNTDITTNTNNIATNTANIQTLSDSAVKYDDSTSKDSITLAGSSGTKLTNLAAGTLSDTSTDAVNGSQLNATNNNVTTNAGNIATNTTDIATNTGNIATNTTNIQTLSDSAVKYDDSTAKDSITLAGASGTKITNVTAGTLSDTSTDAVNGSQLNATNNNVTANAGNIATNTTDIAGNKTNITANTTAINTVAGNTSSYLGGGADVAAGTAPSYTVQGATANNVGDALKAVDSSFNSVNNSLTNITNNINNGSIGPVRRTSGDNLALIAADGTADAPGNSQKLTNLTAGTLSDSSTDAVNGSQLNATNSNVTANAGNIATNTTDIATNTTNIQTLSDSAVKYDDSTAKDSITLAGASGTKLTNLTAGTLSDTSTDAVNGSQLNATNNNVTTNAGNIATNTTAINTVATNTSSYLGGGADVAAGTAPTYTVQGATANNVGDALKAVDSSFNSVNNSLTNITNNINNGSIGPVRRTSGDNLALIAADGTADAPGTTQKLTNLSAGIVSATSTEAINGAQLQSAYDQSTRNSQQVASYLGGGAAYAGYDNWTAPSYTIHSISTTGATTSARYDNVGSALGAMDSSLSNVNNQVNQNKQDINTINNQLGDISNGKSGPVQRTDSTTLSLIDSDNGTTTPQKLTNVAAGTIAAGSTDAVNGSQLNDTNTRIDNTNTRIDGIDSRVGNIEGQIKNIGSAANAVQYDTDSDGNKTNSVTLQGADASTPVALHNVAAGTVAKGSTDAVNGGQLSDAKDELNTSIDNTKKELTTSINDTAATTLKSANDYTDSRINNITTNAVEQANHYTDLRFNRLNHRLDNVRDEARSAAAIGLAAASLRFSDRPGKLSFGFGSGYWKSEGAIAFGAGYTSNTGRFRSNITGTVANGAMGVGGGVTFEFN